MGDNKPNTPQRGSDRQAAEKTGKQAACDQAAEAPGPESPRDDQGNWYAPEEADVVDESSMDSFPCSDPPSI